MLKYFLLLSFLAFLSVLKGQPVNHRSAAKNTRHWYAGISGGYSNLLNKVPVDLGDEFANYMKRLKSGWHTGIEAGYFFNRYIGAGINYTVFFTKESQDSITATNGVFKITGNLSDKMNIQGISPMFYGRVPLKKGKMNLVAGIGPTYLNYHNVGKALTDSATFTGSSPGALGKIRFDYAISKNLCLGVNGAYTYAFLRKFNKITVAGEEIIILEKGNYQNISRLDAAIFLGWTFR